MAIGTLVVALAVALTLAFRGAGEDDEIAHAFLTHLQAGEMDAASALMRRRARAEFQADLEAGRFDPMEPIIDITFTATRTHISTGGRQTDLIGQAITATGCIGRVRLSLSNGRITFFEMLPICGQPGASL